MTGGRESGGGGQRAPIVAPDGAARRRGARSHSGLPTVPALRRAGGGPAWASTGPAAGAAKLNRL